MGTTPVGVVRSWNLASERMFGYPAAEAIGKSVVDLLAPSGEQEGMRKLLSAVAAGEVVRHQARRRRADGTMIDTAATVSPVRDEQGAVSSISAVVRDTSDQVRQARNRAAERDVIAALASANDAAEAAAGTLQAIGEGLDCDFGLVSEIDEDGERLRCTALWVSEKSIAAPLAESMRERSVGRGQGLAGRVWASGESVWAESLAGVVDSPRTADAIAAGLRSGVALPLRSAGDVVGVVEFFTTMQTRHSAGLLAIGDAAVARLADALQRHRAKAALRDASRALEHRVRERTGELQHALEELDAAQTETVRRLSQAVEFRDEDTGAHIARMSALAGDLARRAGLDTGQCRLECSMARTLRCFSWRQASP